MLRAHAWRLLLGFFVLSLANGCGREGPAGRPVASAPDASPAPLDESRYAPAAAATTPAPIEGEVARVQVESLQAYGGNAAAPAPSAPAPAAGLALPAGGAPAQEPPTHEGRGPGEGGDKFAKIDESPFLPVATSPLSTFSIDVDTASYSKVRSFLVEQHRLPPPDAVRIEELVNYFDYAYAPPTDEHPFAVHLEAAQCPWQPQHQLVRIGLMGKALAQRPASNLVFLIDVSGSMQAYNKLPLVQQALGMLTRQLGENDRVSIVVYAGAAGLVLPPTSGQNQPEILAAIDNLQAGGSTNGGAGIQLAYKLAEENLIKGGVNRVVLCSDGDFNVGVTSPGDLIRMAEEKAKLGVHLAVLGFGIGNHNDALLEQLADKANGHYAFIDTPAEARKVFVEQVGGTLVTIAQDVKIQVEFNPQHIAAYRLIGYENRRLADRDFNDDTKDAGEIGAGHRVTALYEIVPPGVSGTTGGTEVDPLKYQQPKGAGAEPVAEKDKPADALAAELLTVKLRYQPPGGGKSTLLTQPLAKQEKPFAQASRDFQFAGAVAGFGMLLQQSKYKGDLNLGAVFELAATARGDDRHGYRQEFLELVRKAQEFSGAPVSPLPQPAAQPAAAPLPAAAPQPASGAFLPPVASRAFVCGTVDPPPSPWAAFWPASLLNVNLQQLSLPVRVTLALLGFASAAGMGFVAALAVVVVFQQRTQYHMGMKTKAK